MVNLRMDLLIAQDINYQLEQAIGDLDLGFKEGAKYRLERAHGFCQNLENRLADDIEEVS